VIDQTALATDENKQDSNADIEAGKPFEDIQSDKINVEDNEEETQNES